MSIAAMYLKMTGVTGESLADGHIGDIDLVSWGWGLLAPYDTMTGAPSGATSFHNLNFTKRVDRATPTLFQFVDRHQKVSKATLTVSKSSGGAALEYLTIEMSMVRVITIDVKSEDAELMENVSLAFQNVAINYTPQSTLGTQGSGPITYESTRTLPDPDSPD